MSDAIQIDQRFGIPPAPSTSTSSPVYNHSHESEEYSYSSDDEDDDDDSSQYTYDSDLIKTSAQQQWEDSIVQLTTLLNFVIIPLVGRMFGRRFSGFVWRKIADNIWKVR